MGHIGEGEERRMYGKERGRETNVWNREGNGKGKETRKRELAGEKRKGITNLRRGKKRWDG